MVPVVSCLCRMCAATVAAFGGSLCKDVYFLQWLWFFARFVQAVVWGHIPDSESPRVINDHWMCCLCQVQVSALTWLL